MRSRRLQTGAVCCAVATLSACGLPPMVSDSGYRGTWRRGSERSMSTVAITEIDGRWYFRWKKRSLDGKQDVHCEWDGQCVERSNGREVARYTITTHYDASRGVLFTDTLEERLGANAKTFRYTDVMEIADHGLTLWNSTVDRDGQHFEGDARPRRVAK